MGVVPLHGRGTVTGLRHRHMTAAPLHGDGAGAWSRHLHVVGVPSHGRGLHGRNAVVWPMPVVPLHVRDTRHTTAAPSKSRGAGTWPRRLCMASVP